MSRAGVLEFFGVTNVPQSLRRERADEPPSGLLGTRFNLTDVGELFDDLPHDSLSFVDVRHFPAAKNHRYRDLVTMAEEVAGLIDLELDVVFAGLRPQPNLLEFGLMDVGFVLLLFLLVFELAEIHDPADWRPLIGGNLDEVEPC